MKFNVIALVIFLVSIVQDARYVSELDKLISAVDDGHVRCVEDL